MKNYYKYTFLLLAFVLFLGACKKDFLTEAPKDNIYADNLLVDYDGFQTIISALQGMMRHEYRRVDAFGGVQSLPFSEQTMFSVGADNAWSNNTHNQFKFMYYPKYIDQTDLDCFRVTFDWLYKMINTANLVISRAENPGINWSGGSKEEILAQARFYRAWAYRHLTLSFGAVPLITQEVTGSNYRTDWERNPLPETRKVMEEDLLFTIDNLPMRTANNTMVSGAVARHYLGELYLAENQAQKAKEILKPLVEGNEYG